MNAMSRPPPAPMINAPFSPEQRAWLNGFFAGLLSSDSQPGTALPAPESAALAATLAPAAAAPGLEDDGAPRHDQTMPLGERMKLAEGRPLRRRMMAAMGQQDCGQCGYDCKDYANAIDELSGFQAAGTLAKLSLAWSRDGEKKVYVQDKIREAGADLCAWLGKGAHFYVCGDAKRMAPDVDAALVHICAEHGKMDAGSAKAFVGDLRAQHRYQTDVY